MVLGLGCCGDEEAIRVVEGFDWGGYDMVVWRKLAFMSFERLAGGDVVEGEGDVGRGGLGGGGGWMA